MNKKEFLLMVACAFALSGFLTYIAFHIEDARAATPPATVPQGGTGYGSFSAGAIPIGAGFSLPGSLRLATSSNFTFATSTGILTTDSLTVTGNSTTSGKTVNANGSVLTTTATYTVSTSSNTGDFTSITDALAALPSGGGKVVITCGTFTVSGGIPWSYSNVTLEGQGDCTQINVSASTTAIRMADTTQRSLNHVKHMRIVQNGTTGTGTCVDFSYFAISSFEEVDCSGFRIGYVGSTTGTLYNSILYPRVSVSGGSSYGYIATSTANFNLLKKPRIITTTDSVGIAIDAHANTCEECNVETGALIGVYVGPNGNEAYFPGLYLEGNQTNISLASGVTSVNIESAFVADATTANLIDNGASNFKFSGRIQYVGQNFLTGANFGLGTTTPQYPLDVVTSGVGLQTLLSLRSSIGQASEEQAIDFGAAAQGGTNRTFARISAIGGTSFQNSLLKFWTDNGSGTITLREVIDKNGNHGIGTTTPYARLSVHAFAGSTNTTLFAVASSTATATTTLLSLSNGGQLSTSESRPATSTSMIVDWLNTPNQVVLQIGQAANVVSFSSASTTGMTKRIVICNPNGTASTVTWNVPGLLWSGGTAPTQTTTANKCDVYSFIISQATSTTATNPTIFGGASQNY